MRLITVLCFGLVLSACSGEDPAPSGDAEPAAAAPAGQAPVEAPPPRTGTLRDPDPQQVQAVAAAWLGRPVDHEAAARDHPDYERADAAARPAVLARLTEQSRAAAAAATNVGVLDVNVPISGVAYDAAAGAFLLPVFSPGSTIALAPSHALRLSNAEAAYALGMGNAAARSMQATNARPARVRLTARIESVQPTANGAVFIGQLQGFTLYDAEGGAIGEAVSMSGFAPNPAS